MTCGSVALAAPVDDLAVLHQARRGDHALLVTAARRGLRRPVHELGAVEGVRVIEAEHAGLVERGADLGARAVERRGLVGRGHAGRPDDDHVVVAREQLGERDLAHALADRLDHRVALGVVDRGMRQVLARREQRDRVGEREVRAGQEPVAIARDAVDLVGPQRGDRGVDRPVLGARDQHRAPLGASGQGGDRDEQEHGEAGHVPDHVRAACHGRTTVIPRTCQVSAGGEGEARTPGFEQPWSPRAHPCEDTSVRGLAAVDLRVRIETTHGLCSIVELSDAEVDAALAALPSAEQALAHALSPVRRRELITGRTALHATLAELAPELAATAILADDRGAPVLPAGWVGSISHKGARAAALVAPAGDAQIGVDLELAQPARQDIARWILTPREQAQLVDRGRGATLRFSIKEAIYKAIDPFVRRYVAFTEVELEVSEAGVAQVRLGAAARDRDHVARARGVLARDRARAHSLRERDRSRLRSSQRRGRGTSRSSTVLRSSRPAARIASSQIART